MDCRASTLGFLAFCRSLSVFSWRAPKAGSCEVQLTPSVEIKQSESQESGESPLANDDASCSVGGWEASSHLGTRFAEQFRRDP